MYIKSTSNSYIYTKIVQTVATKLVATKFWLKMPCNLKCMLFVHTNNVQTIQNLDN